MSESELEKKVNDKQSKGFIRKAFDFGFNVAVAAGTTALALAIPAVGVVGSIISGAFAGGGLIGGLISRKKTGTSLGDLINGALKTYSAVNAVLYPMFLLGD